MNQKDRTGDYPADGAQGRPTLFFCYNSKPHFIFFFTIKVTIFCFYQKLLLILLSILESFLKDRWQAVWIDHLFSDYANINVGVPQGSLMGPILFNIFLNDLLSSVSCNIDCYADDSTLTKQGNSSDLVSTGSGF